MYARPARSRPGSLAQVTARGTAAQQRGGQGRRTHALDGCIRAGTPVAMYQSCRARQGLRCCTPSAGWVARISAQVGTAACIRGSGCLYVRGCLLCQLSMALGSLVVPKPMRMLTRRLVRAEWEKCEIRCGQSEVGAPDGQSTFNRADLIG